MSNEQPEKKNPVVISIDQEGKMLPSTFSEAWHLASVYLKSGMLPARYQTPEAVVTAMQYAAEIGIRGITALRQIAVIDGTPSIYGDLPLAVCRAKGMISKFEEFFTDKTGKRISIENGNIGEDYYAAVCRVHRKGEDSPVTSIFTVDDAKLAGLWNKTSQSGKPSTWVKYPKRMMQFRARSTALKDSCPDALNGIAIGEYDLNTTIEEVADAGTINAPVPDPASALNQMAGLSKPKEIVVEYSNPGVNLNPGSQPIVGKTTEVGSTQGSFDDYSDTRIPMAPAKELTQPTIDRSRAVSNLIAEAQRVGIGLDQVEKYIIGSRSKDLKELPVAEIIKITSEIKLINPGGKNAANITQ